MNDNDPLDVRVVRALIVLGMIATVIIGLGITMAAAWWVARLVLGWLP